MLLLSSTPLIQSITHTNAKRIVQTSPVKKHLMVFSDPLASYHTALLEEIRPVAEALRGQVRTYFRRTYLKYYRTHDSPSPNTLTVLALSPITSQHTLTMYYHIDRY